MLTILVCTVVVLLTIKWWLSKKSEKDELLSLIPGPKDSDRIQRELDLSKSHVVFHELSKTYGPIACMKYPDDKTVILSSFEHIYKALVTKGKEFGVRPFTFRDDHIYAASGILCNEYPDSKWRLLRKITHQHIKQFGDGLPRIEALVKEVSKDMFETFLKNIGNPYNPRKDISLVAMSILTFLLYGQYTKAGDPMVDKIREYLKLFLETHVIMDVPWTFLLLDKFPWLSNFGFKQWRELGRMKSLHDEIWEHMKQADQKSGYNGLCQVFMKQLREHDDALKEPDVQAACLVLLSAGMNTTSLTFYAGINALAHHPKIQKKLHDEIRQTKETYGQVTLNERSNMHYTRAVLFEMSRFSTIAPITGYHQPAKTGEIGGYKIPEGALMIMNLWSLHHEEDFWGNPYEFEPERFLDEHGEVLPADHPNRTHLMPFGAGTRVCVGEAFAMARLFIWLTTFFDQFEVKPAPGNDISTIDMRNGEFVATTEPPDYEVIITHRN